MSSCRWIGTSELGCMSGRVYSVAMIKIHGLVICRSFGNGTPRLGAVARWNPSCWVEPDLECLQFESMPTSSDIEDRRAGIIGRLVVVFEDFASVDAALIVLI